MAQFRMIQMVRWRGIAVVVQKVRGRKPTEGVVCFVIVRWWEVFEMKTQGLGEQSETMCR